MENNNNEIKTLRERAQEEIMEALSKEIVFIDKFRDKYHFLSNMYECEIEYNGNTYHSSEAAFQAQKDLNGSHEFTFITNPVEAKHKGRTVKLRSDWEDVKLSIMEEIVRCKFTQNKELGEKLVETGNKILVEGNDWNDTYWGVCNHKGYNHLGKILEKVRREIIKSKNI